MSRPPLIARPCPQCDSGLQLGARFCPNCGVPIPVEPLLGNQNGPRHAYGRAAHQSRDQTVPYPGLAQSELYENIGRNSRSRIYGQPSLIPTFVVTLLFGAFGLIPAMRHSHMARERGYSTRGYWWTFGLTLLIPALLSLITLWIILSEIQHVSDAGAVGLQGQQSSPLGSSSSGGLNTGQTPGPTTNLQGTALVQGGIARDPAGDATEHDGEPGTDLTGFSWSAPAGSSDVQFTVSFAAFAQSQDATIYLGSGSGGDGTNCPGMPDATFRIDISGEAATVYSEDGGACQDASQIDSFIAKATSTGWIIQIPVSDLGLSSGSQYLVRVLGYTQLDPDTTTTIQDELPNSDNAPLLISYP